MPAFFSPAIFLLILQRSELGVMSLRALLWDSSPNIMPGQRAMISFLMYLSSAWAVWPRKSRKRADKTILQFDSFTIKYAYSLPLLVQWASGIVKTENKWAIVVAVVRIEKLSEENSDLTKYFTPRRKIHLAKYRLERMRIAVKLPHSLPAYTEVLVLERLWTGSLCYKIEKLWSKWASNSSKTSHNQT